jgi:hypothetical protein
MNVLLLNRPKKKKEDRSSSREVRKGNSSSRNCSQSPAIAGPSEDEYFYDEEDLQLSFMVREVVLIRDYCVI